MKKLLLFLALFWAMNSSSQDYCTTPANSEYKELVLDTYRDLDVSMTTFLILL